MLWSAVAGLNLELLVGWALADVARSFCYVETRSSRHIKTNREQLWRGGRFWSAATEPKSEKRKEVEDKGLRILYFHFHLDMLVILLHMFMAFEKVMSS